MAGISDTPLVCSDNPWSTRPVIQNNTDSETKRSDFNNWQGYGPAPETIEANRTGEFKHFADNKGSYGGVAYQVVNGGKWIIAWKNLLNVNNKAYTKILNPGEEFYWDVIFSNLEKANSNKSCDNNAGFSASIVIDVTGGIQHLQQYSNLLLNKWLCSMHLQQPVVVRLSKIIFCCVHN